LLTLLGLVSFTPLVRCDGGDDGDDGDDGGDDGGAADDYFDDLYIAEEDYDGDDYIKYWTDYAILPKRCIVYNDVDVIMFSVYEHGYKQCSDSPMGTYLTPVPRFVTAYLKEVKMNENDKGNDDYAHPESVGYLQCQQVEIQNQVYYVQLGCTDGTSQSLSVNIYEDNTCEKRSTVDGFDDSNIDVSDLQLPFKSCQACVVWLDKNDDVDDQYYEYKKTNAPLCSSVWQYKSTCNSSCQKMGMEPTMKDSWTSSDKVLLTVLSAFGCAMLGAILQKRQQMSNKDALLEQAAMTAAGLQQSHVIGIFVLVLVVIVIFASLVMKNITWAMLLMMNTVLFAYLMKLTVDSSVARTIVGPDGQLIRIDSDDTSIASSTNQMDPPSVSPLPPTHASSPTAAATTTDGAVIT